MNLLFRADASLTMGTGHVMRCLALAQAWQDCGARVTFALAESTPALRERLLSESFAVVPIKSAAGAADDSQETVALARERRADWIVVDGYQFGADYQRTLKAAGFKVLWVDDYGHADHYSADFVLNQNVGVTPAIYADREPHTQLFVGPRYCLLRREFSAWRDWRRDVTPKGHRVLVTMGGSDPANLTARALDALLIAKVEQLDAVVVLGGSSPPSEFPEPSAESGKRISVRRDVKNMAELMAWADVAIASAGSTCWELCLLGLSSVLVDVAENQTAVARELARRGCAVHIRGAKDFTAQRVADHLESLLHSRETRLSMSTRCCELVDGKGSLRVVSAMRAGLRLRPARETDCRQLWEWANDPQVRSAAFSRATIPWEQHQAWFASKMKDPNCRIFVAENEQGKAVGQFRVDWRSAGDGEIDVSVAAECRGAGVGAVLIDMGTNRAFEGRPGRLHALVKAENQASRRAFEAAGFTSLGEEDAHGQRAIHYACGENTLNMRSE